KATFPVASRLRSIVCSRTGSIRICFSCSGVAAITPGANTPSAFAVRGSSPGDWCRSRKIAPTMAMTPAASQKVLRRFGDGSTFSVLLDVRSSIRNSVPRPLHYTCRPHAQASYSTAQPCAQPTSELLLAPLENGIERIPLLAEEGWRDSLIEAGARREPDRAKPQLVVSSAKSVGCRSDHPVCAASVATRHFLWWRSHPSSARRGMCLGFGIVGGQ